ncbi:MAG: hypothetical protein EOO89_22230 [Pedobacter sp.]|nr:MAG: hypothetical protein EOO89_22230 [Pedobacter sp.]
MQTIALCTMHIHILKYAVKYMHPYTHHANINTTHFDDMEAQPREQGPGNSDIGVYECHEADLVVCLASLLEDGVGEYRSAVHEEAVFCDGDGKGIPVLRRGSRKEGRFGFDKALTWLIG